MWGPFFNSHCNCSASNRCLNRGKCRIGLIGIGTTALCHIRAATATFAAELFDTDADQIDRAEFTSKVFGQANND